MKLHLPIGLRVALLTAVSSVSIYAEGAYTGTLILQDELFSGAVVVSENTGLPANSVEFNFIEEPRSLLEDAQHPLSIACSAGIETHTKDRINTYTAEPTKTPVSSQIPAAVFSQLTSSPTPCSYSISASAPLFGSTGSAPSIAPVASAPANANVPSGYTEVTITSPDQISAYSSSDYIAFVIGDNITDSEYRITGNHQYWGDQIMQAHVLTFRGLNSESDGGAVCVNNEFAAEGFKELIFTSNHISRSDYVVGDYVGGSAIYADEWDSIVNLIGNGRVEFSENSSTSSGNSGPYTHGGAIFTVGLLNVIGNDHVTFSGNSASSTSGDGGEARAFGGAVCGRYVTLSGNGCVMFSNNSASASSAGRFSSDGGAICADEYGGLDLTNNTSVTFSGNTASFGGAIYAPYMLQLNLTGNGNVTFSGNTASTSGGAIYAPYVKQLNLTGNGNVTFSENSAEYGGAIYDSYGTLNLTGNVSLTFSNNSSTSGGAIYAGDGSTVNLSGNGNVTFRGNYEKAGNESSATYRLRSIYKSGGTLKLAAGAGQNITFYDTLYADSTSTVSFNANYMDKAGVEREATGDIVFSGKCAAEDLNALKADYTQQELTNSLTTEVQTTTNLYGGRLRIEDGAIYKGRGINVAADSGATLRLANGTLEQAGYDVVLESGTTLDLTGKNSITASSLDMMDGSTLSFTLGKMNMDAAALTLDGTFNQGGALTINLIEDGTMVAGESYKLFSLTEGKNPEFWDQSQIILTGLDTDTTLLMWKAGVLYYDYFQVTITWNGAQSRKWNGSDVNWTQDGAANHYTNGTLVVFGDTASGEVVLEGALAPRKVHVNNSSNHDYTFSGDGKLTGGMQLTKDGEGTLTINTANDYTGGTFLNAGTLVAGNASAFGYGTIQINGGELDLGGNAIANALSIKEGVDAVISNGSINTLDFTVSGGSLDADNLHIATHALGVADAGEVSFCNANVSGDGGGGAICADSDSTVNLTGNGSVTFSDNNTASPSGYFSNSNGGAIFAGSNSTVNLTGNDSVAFNGNSAYEGGAIYARFDSIIDFVNNSSVTFSNNSARFAGGAIFADGTLNVTNNGSVTFKENTAEYGGAIFADGTLNITNNSSVVFSGNQVSSSSNTHCGGAIYMSFDSTANLASNDSVTFIGNSAEYGGAISSHSMSIIDFTNNGSVIFNGNSAKCGGAISNSTVNLTGNDSVTFSGNSAKYSGGAIHANDASLNIAGNNHVEFRGNYEKTDSDVSATYRLRSVYVYGGTLELAAGEEQDITFFDTLYAGGGYSGTMEVSFNADYKDKDGVMQKATGDIIFSGKHAAEDLAALKPSYMQQELRDSLTSEVYATTNLYGGRLRIEDGAIYKGNGINVAADSRATLRLANGTLEQADYDVVLESGTTLDLTGKNSITASSLDMMDGSTLSLTLGKMNMNEAVLTLNGTFNQGGVLTINLTDDDTMVVGGSYKLVSLAGGINPGSWDQSQIILTGQDTDTTRLMWKAGVLYYDSPATTTWNGAQSRKWNDTDVNWVQDGTANRYTDGTLVVFGDTASGEVVLEGALAPRNVLVGNSTNHDYTFTGDGKLTGSMQLTKEGGGTLTIGTANDYTGGTVLNAGTVNASGADSFGLNSIQLNGGTLNLKTYAVENDITANGGTISGSAYNGALTVLGDVTVNGILTANSIDLKSGSLNGGSITDAVVYAHAGSIGSDITGESELDIDGDVVFSGTADHTLGTYVNSGSLTLTGTISSDIVLIGGTLKAEQLQLGEWQLLEFSGGSVQGNVSARENAMLILYTDSTIDGDLVLDGALVELNDSSLEVTGRLTVENGSFDAQGGIHAHEVQLGTDSTMEVHNSDGETVYSVKSVSGQSAHTQGVAFTAESITGSGETPARIDNAFVKLEENSRVEVSNIILGATSRLTDDPATVVANNLVIEGQYGVNVEEGAPMTIKSGSIMQRLGQPSELIELDSDATACRLDITNVDSVSITGNSLTIDLSGMYPALLDYSQKFDWLGISLGSGDQVAALDTNMVVEVKLNDRLSTSAYYMSSEGWGGENFVMPVANGENVGMIYVCMFDVPEPATSTLSLLALAALAARHRRKQ